MNSRYLTIAKRLFIESDTSTVRAILAVASLLFGIGLFLPLQTFNRPSFAAMATVAPAWVWGTLFFVHAAGVAWRFVDDVPRVGWAFAINALGLALWIVYTGLTTTYVGEYTPSTAMEITVLLAALVALIRTGLNDERFTP